MGKRLKKIFADNSFDSLYAIDEGADLAISSSTAKFQETIDICLNLNIDPKKGEINDAFISNKAQNIDELSYGSIVGTSSVRRAALLRNKRPDLKITLFRGNVDTRLSKLDRGDVDATLLAVAGLKRLGLESRITKIMSLDEMPPAVAQGAIGAQCRTPRNKLDRQLWEWLEAINHKDSETRVEVILAVK